MALSAQAQLTSVVSEILALCTGLAGIYLVGNVVFTLAQAHLGAVSGQPRVLADMLDRIIPAVICFAIALTARDLGNAVGGLLSASTANNATEALALWQALASFVVNTVLYSAGASLAVAFATGAFSAQLAVFVGQPQALSLLWTRLLLALGTGVLTLTSVTIANAIIRSAR